ncbi:MAG TPA: hypothetical protein VGO17_17025, partial [Aurantimonas sp.]|nr:hypothetical protein [Aurantimonas sp.]
MPEELEPAAPALVAPALDGPADETGTGCLAPPDGVPALAPASLPEPLPDGAVAAEGLDALEADPGAEAP